VSDRPGPRPLAAAALAAAPATVHGFFTREGGVSEGIYASLNCGFGSRDAAERVAENRLRALAALGLDGATLCTAYQCHSARCVVVERPWPHERAPKADALATRAAGIALGVLTADCAPVLFADPDAGVIGAAHAGWRGALDGVLEAALAAMERLGARRPRIVAAVGPCIGARSYEVGPEFRDRFVAADPANAALFAPAPRDGRLLFDLAGYVLGRLERLGLGRIERVRGDTCADDARFFSYRRARRRGEPSYGRLLSAIALKP